MGFTEKQAKKALSETGNNVERAVDWLFSHPTNQLKILLWTMSRKVKVGNLILIIVTKHTGPARYRLFAFVSHKGSSAHCGHYVSFILKDDKWVIFNDNKVAHVEDISKHMKEGYLYFFKKEN